jgi:protein phosphatase PTC2/3
VFDGHGGHSCADFLRDKLHNLIAASPSFPSNLEAALKEGCEEAEREFMV